ADGRTVDVHIKHAQKNAEAQQFTFGRDDAGGFRYLAIAGRHDQTFAFGDFSRRIAKEPEKEQSKQDGDNGPTPLASEIPQQSSRRKETDTVEIAVTNHSGSRNPLFHYKDSGHPAAAHNSPFAAGGSRVARQTIEFSAKLSGDSDRHALLAALQGRHQILDMKLEFFQPDLFELFVL